MGTNSRLDTIQAAILRVKLKYLKNWNRQRKQIAEIYSKNLKDISEIKLPSQDSVFHQYTFRLRSRHGRGSPKVAGQARDKLKKFLVKKGIPTMIYYPLPLHLQPALKYLGYKKGDFPEAEKAAKEVLSLPIYPDLSKENQDFIVKKVKEFYQK